MKQIILSQGKFSLIDDDDYEYINQYKWFCSAGGYAVRNIRINKNKRTVEWMHRVINKTLDGFDTDHINGDKLDNRKENLRSCLHRQNGRNRKLNRNNKMRVKGVSIERHRGKLKVYEYIRADIMTEEERIFLGHFSTIELASQAYQDAAKKYFQNYMRAE